MNIVANAVTNLALARQQFVAPEGFTGSELAASIRASVAPLIQVISDPFGPMDVFFTERIPNAVDLAKQAATLVQAHERPFAANDMAAPIANITKAIELLTAPGASAIEPAAASPFAER